MKNGSGRNIIHVMASSNYQRPLKNLMDSLYKHAPIFKLHFVELGDASFYKDYFEEKEKITYSGDWEDRVSQIRIESYLKFDYEEGDRVISMDADMIVKDDPFTVFDLFEDGDVLLSTRDHFDKIPVIACFWGFRWNNRTHNFLNYIKKQAKEKLNWKVLKDFRKRRQHIGVGWWLDQDVLCAAYQDGYKDLRIRDIGWHWSYDVNNKLNRKSREGKIKRDSAKALHYKDSKKWRNLR